MATGATAGTVASAQRLSAERHRVILAELHRRGTVRVSELATLLEVSEMTVRRDLDLLDSLGRLHKVHGGARIAEDRSTDEPGFDAKSRLAVKEKHAIAIHAARRVSAGSAIGITGGTTTWHLAFHLCEVPGLTVLTNSMRVAEVLHERGRPDQTVVLTGGVRTPSDSLVGPTAQSALRAVHLDAVFMGVHGMSQRFGLSTPNLMEVETNRAFLAATDNLVVVADHSKWNQNGFSVIAPLSAARTLVTDDGYPDGVRQVLTEHVDEVVFVPVVQDATTEVPSAHPRAEESAE